MDLSLALRHLSLFGGQAWLGWLLYIVIISEDAVTKGAVWPLTVAFLLMFMIPASRLGGDLFVQAIQAFKGVK